MPYRRLHVGMYNKFEIRGDHVAIFVPARGAGMMEALIDLGDLEMVRAVPTRWRAVKTKSPNRLTTWYVIAEVWQKETRTYVYLHRLIMGNPVGFVVDHDDGNGLENRRFNLKVVSKSVNNKHRVRAQSTNTSGFRGVTYHRKARKWMAQARFNKKQVYLGCYPTPEEAATVVAAFWKERGF